MQNKIIVGINHKTATIEVREKYYLTEVEQKLLLSELKCHPQIIEAFILSTCNRTEIYANVSDVQKGKEIIYMEIHRIKNLSVIPQDKSRFYFYEAQHAINHLLRVTSGLESLILGEKQILGQVKKAFELAEKSHMLGKHFHILSNLTLRAGKKAHHETEISYGGASVSWAAVNLAAEFLDGLEGKSLLVIGAGEMAELTSSAIMGKGLQDIFIMNRTQDHAEALAKRFGGQAVGFWDMDRLITEVDVCICSVSAPHYIVEPQMIQSYLPARKGKPLCLIDISIPRSVDPRVQDLDGVNLFYIDELDKHVASNLNRRKAAIPEVEMIIQEKITAYQAKLSALTKMSSDTKYASK